MVTSVQGGSLKLTVFPCMFGFEVQYVTKILNIIESILEEIHENCQQVIVTQLIHVIEFILDHKQIYVI